MEVFDRADRIVERPGDEDEGRLVMKRLGGDGAEDSAWEVGSQREE